MNRRKLSSNQEVVLIYLKTLGFVIEKANFIQYNIIDIDGNLFSIPFFKWKDKTISGLECFWLFPEDASSNETIERFQYQLIDVQISALEIGIEAGIKIPNKMRDKEMEKIAQDNVDRVKNLVTKLGYDPRDESWLESTLAITEKERKWFAFERKNPAIFAWKWPEIVSIFNKDNSETISVEDAKQLSKKRMRYVLGSFHVRFNGNSDQNAWIKSAKEFESLHREAENRMISWSLARQNNFPLAKSKEPIRFTAGPYFNECIEKIPHVFTDKNINYIRSNIVLRVVSYDPVKKYIKLDFTKDVKNKIKDSDEKPWIKEEADYNIWLKPEEIDSHLIILEKLDDK